MHCNVNESTLIEKISRFLTYGLMSLNKEVEMGYGEDSRDDNNTQDRNPHPSISVNAVRFFKKTFAYQKLCSNFRV